MSIITTVYIPDGIIMAADSRLTRTMPFKSGDKDVIKEFTSTDCSQKVTLLGKSRIGIMSCGDAMPNNQTVSDYLRLFEIEDVDESDSVTEIANKLKERVTKEKVASIFTVAGYTKDEPFVFGVSRDEVVRINLERQRVQYGVSWNGQLDAINRLLKSEPVTQPNYPLMQLKDGIDFAEFLVDLTIKYERFADDIQTCGGSIDILVITKDDAFWYRHKVFTPETK